MLLLLTDITSIQGTYTLQCSYVSVNWDHLKSQIQCNCSFSVCWFLRVRYLFPSSLEEGNRSSRGTGEEKKDNKRSKSLTGWRWCSEMLRDNTAQYVWSTVNDQIVFLQFIHCPHCTERLWETGSRLFLSHFSVSQSSQQFETTVWPHAVQTE